MYLRVSSLLLLASLFALSNAQVPFPRQCPKVTLLTSFDVEAYTGIWYEYSKYPFIFEIGKKCMYAKYEIIGNDTISVVNSAINIFTNRPSNVTGQAKIKGPGQLAVSLANQNQNFDKTNYIVLGTDYESYSVVYSCSSATPIAHTKIIWILTRERKPSQATIDTALKVLVDNQLSQSFLIDTEQDGCPDVNDANNVETTVSDEETTTTELDDLTTQLPNRIVKL